MKFKNIFFLTVTFSFLFTGCSYKTSEEVVDMGNYPNTSYSASNTNNYGEMYLKSPKKSNFFDELTHQNYITKKDKINEGLFSVYNQWKGTRYKLGGTSKSGIDCSGFVQKVLQQGFGLSMPRDTVSLSKVGTSIKKDELKMGDLVFFKTKRNNHVGIYLEDGKFMHASTKIGVTISELDSDYFKNSYWKAQRIFN
ncbi:NlpC/P60 family protein [Arcobacter lacus]|jgi:lipoprotein Spr|uniref:Peptidase P60 n=1 Tax=Arcobacter lacus TaxID=1912876 RepID=A0ABX5JLH2_9BACT|nr:NlpC/P60 family protein [Arcobacter lacus]MCT7909289.1 NlpC/P60 family protein [Arcobacter lacus]PUE65249.1 peptidase P60 [Arcobacter lacus]